MCEYFFLNYIETLKPCCVGLYIQEWGCTQADSVIQTADLKSVWN